jgi:O-methyltransferase involved in polyketide biosynthesis
VVLGAAPTVWLAEGLLMYIDPRAVAALLQEAAGASAAGSSFLAQVGGTPLALSESGLHHHLS